ncbi:MAG: IclR family transcriptional regulator [Acidimicrobiia bacterium]|nr:IclR family transcriptional regulator [Acidimicrobiia bacterium]
MQSVDRALDVLFLLAQSSAHWPASAIARELDLPRPTVYRILDTLGGKGIVAKGPDGFGVTEKLARITSGPAAIGLSDLVQDHLQSLVGTTGETSGLHVRFGDLRRCVAEVEGHHDIRWARGVGFTAPIWSGAVGYVFLADLDEGELDDLVSSIEFAPLASNTARTADELLDRVHAARARGWSLSQSETVEGACAAAAPVTDHRGRTVAVLSLYAPAVRFEAVQDHVSDLVSTAEKASADLAGTTSTTPTVLVGRTTE